MLAGQMSKVSAQCEVGVLILLPGVNVVRGGTTWGDRASLQGKSLILNSLETLKMSHKVSWNVWATANGSSLS